MTASVSSRLLILERIRIANKVSTLDAYPELPRTYIRRGSLALQPRLELMIERLREYGADVAECGPDELCATITAQLAASGRHNFVAPADLPPEWIAPGFNWTLDCELTADEIEQCEGVVTSASAGVADSGTIVLHHSGGEGRRAISLLPDWHLCILLASQVVETLPEYFDRCQQPPALATYISGPSATADIEMTRIKGVHGPRFLNVILVHDEEHFKTAATSTHPKLGRRP
jgi:L-lactate dehydrogenase complex protein LldG